ncbi:MAG: HAD family hydrolase [Fimbriimonadaceae bacterium]|nr:HAD family hydrolase [Fimbriimonadaceae bacterium]QYK55126.1 MAG: HAD family hydrolase [Fimbriimonadaceae bacterium]
METQVKEGADFSKVRAVFFDLDDTLCAYWDAAKGGLRAALDEVPVPNVTKETLLKTWSEEFRRFASELKTSHWYEIYLSQGGVTRTQLMNEVLLSLGIDDPELAWRLSDSYGRERNARLRLFPESIEVLTVLQRAYPLGMITNGPADIQRQQIATLGINDYFSHILIEGEFGKGKPDIAVMRRAEEMAGVEPHEMLFVGNSYAHDMVPAMDCGWKTFWIRRNSDVAPSSRTGKPEEAPPGSRVPDAVADDLRALFQILGVHAQHE